MAIPQISPEVLAQILQQFNIPAAPLGPPPVQVPPPVVQPEGIATLPQAPVEPLAPPVQVPPPVMQPAPPPPAEVAPAPTVDPSSYSDPGLGVSPMSPREQMGIETMAESVGQGDYLGIPLPDGGTFDLSTLDLRNIGGEG